MKSKHLIYLLLMGFVLSACETNDPNMSKESPFPGFVNLGLPSGTHWKEHNETMCELAEALALYGDSLATIAQWKELYKYCTWTWTGDGYNVKGRNGNSIFLPAEGTYVPYYHEWKDVGSRGEYWTATPLNTSYNYYAGFWSGGFYTDMFGAYTYLSIRCVKSTK